MKKINLKLANKQRNNTKKKASSQDNSIDEAIHNNHDSPEPVNSSNE